MAYAGQLFSLLIGAGLYGLATRAAVPPAAWIGLTALLHASRAMPIGPGLTWLWLLLAVSLGIARRDTMPVPFAVWLPIMAAEASVVAVPFLLDRLLAPPVGGAVGTLVFPVAMVAAEFLRSRLTPAATWGSIAYSQYGFPPIMQVAAFAGIWGITFLISWSASAFELAWRFGFDASVRGAWLPCAITVGAALVAGGVRLAIAPAAHVSIPIATVNRPVDLLVPGEMTRVSEGRVAASGRDVERARLEKLQDWFLGETRRAARAGARMVVWPEQNLLVFAEDEPAFLARARKVAADERVYLAIGMGTIHVGEPLPFENKLVLIDPSGATVGSHLKNRPVAGWEESIMRRGRDGILVVATALGRMAGAICFEADFPEFIRPAGMQAADVLIVPANDWQSIKHLHLQMHVFRAIENGVSIVRAAASGISAAVDSRGRVLNVSDYFTAADRTMTANLPVERVPTVYAKIGDAFAWSCVAALAATFVLRIVFHR
ncbi:MAG TPA: nitrilase-related carbon-nitrogen hydrolase [Vicinamibacterales bacterium]|nr:nitrilase-related carbon-nitrogen hydrolase [Vicinamibacterales bacterium]